MLVHMPFRAPELDVVGIVMGLEQRTAMIGIPESRCSNPCCVWLADTSFSQAVSPEICQSREDFHDAAKLAVGGGVASVIGWAVGDGTSEVHMSAFIH